MATVPVIIIDSQVEKPVTGRENNSCDVGDINFTIAPTIIVHIIKEEKIGQFTVVFKYNTAVTLGKSFEDARWSKSQELPNN